MYILNFKRWILGFKKVNSPIGDLARDIALDSNFPSTNNRQELIDYLQDQGACTSAVNVLESAYDNYLKLNSNS